MVNPDRQHNALAALDIFSHVARADAVELSAWDMQCIRDAEKAILRYEALIAGKGPDELVRSPLGDSRPQPISYWQKLIADNKASIERIRRGDAVRSDAAESTFTVTLLLVRDNGKKAAIRDVRATDEQSAYRAAAAQFPGARTEFVSARKIT